MRLVVANILVLEYCVLTANQVGQVIHLPINLQQDERYSLSATLYLYMNGKVNDLT